MSVNSRLKATNILGQRKAFCRHRISESSCARKETVDIDILMVSKVFWKYIRIIPVNLLSKPLKILLCK